MSSRFYFAIALGLFFFQPHSYGIEDEHPYDAIDLERIVGKYWSWWNNAQEDLPENNPICSIEIDHQDSFVFLLDPFQTGDNNFKCTENPISKGYTILLPLLTSFCSQGDNNLYGKPYAEVRDCTLNLQRGTIKGIVSIDGEEVVNINKNNGKGIEMKGILQDNLPQFKYYKHISATKFVDILVTNKTQFTDNWQKPEEFKQAPIFYKAVVDCECVIIDTNQLGPGIHNLKYDVVADSQDADAQFKKLNGWSFTASTAYQIKIQ